MREALLTILIKEPSHGWELHQRLSSALGASVPPINAGQVYMTLSRLERAGLVTARSVEQGSRPDKRVYQLTAAGRDAASDWLADVSWSKVAPVEFHLKLVAAAATGAADPVALIDAQRRELLRVLGALQRETTKRPGGGDDVVLAEGAALRLQADLRWLEVCERHWSEGDHR
ncbi:MAG: PadR family transcriptional regulator [Actinomycetota bacterium]|nr:PadR family transcriptional regulator [Actinomycetota bacterium]